MNKLQKKSSAIQAVIDREGGYVNHPDDGGGPTCWGVTQAVARRHGYQGDMKYYPIDKAVAVYEQDYWRHVDAIANDGLATALQLFDFAVNSGPAQAIGCLQRLLNSLNNRGKDYPDIKADGVSGPQTLAAFKSFHRRRGEEGLAVLTQAINGLRIAFCVGITERNESQEAFTYGWLARVVHL
ncbi:MAG: hypothetical protein K0U59_06570 [Gammaproteobacteria bacterium]|nr:hypothetical protein [Gammaproteobacteria bacterium]